MKLHIQISKKSQDITAAMEMQTEIKTRQIIVMKWKNR